jgi:hypothetical protein
VGVDEANAGVSLTQGVSDGKTRSVDLDISTSQGWNAYQSFIETGKLPADGAAGTANPTTSRVLNFTSADELKAHLGPVDVTLGGSHLDASVVETTHPDGSKQDTLIDNHGRTQLVQSYGTGADGTVSNERYAIRLQDPKGAYLPDGNGHLTPTDGRDITFTYTPSDLQEMQNAAIDTILAESKRTGEGEFKDGGTREQVRQYLQEHPYDYNLPNVGSITMNPAILAMAGASDVSKVAWALLQAGQGNASQGMLFMEEFSLLTKQARHELGMPPGQDTIQIGGVTNRPAGC